MLLFAEAAASLIENFWGVYLLGRLTGKRKIKRRYSCIAVIFLTICVSVINQYILFSVITSMIAILLMAFVAKILYLAKFTESLFIVGIYILAAYIFDFLVLSLLGMIFNNFDFVGILADRYFYLRTGGLILSKLFLSSITLLFLKYFDTFENKLELLNFKKWLWLFLKIIILHCLVNGILLQSDINVFISWLMVLILIILAIYIILQHFIIRTQKEHILLEMECIRMKVKNYEYFMENYRRNQAFYHDLKNHYLVLKAYLVDKEYKKAETYLDNLDLPPQTDLTEKKTGIETLDILITYKKNEAERKEIYVSMITEPISLKLTETETVVLFGNLLDNAIEACENMENSKRWISITIRKIRDMQFIKIVNSYQGEPQQKDGKFQTKKANKDIHGTGLKNVMAIIEKYEGVLKTEYNKEMFSLTISFFN